MKVKVLTDPVIVISGDGLTYDGTEKKPAVTVKDGDAVLDASEYTVSYENNINAGTATVIITDVAGGAYNVSGRGTFSIGKAAVTVTADDKTAALNGTKPALTYSVSGLLGSDKLTAEPTLTCNANMGVLGQYEITASGADAGSNYAITYVKGTLTVSEVDKTSLRELVYAMRSKTQEDNSDTSWKQFRQALATAEAALANPSASPEEVAAAEAGLSAAAAGLQKVKPVSAPVIELSQTVFTYDGTEKMPGVTVKDGDTVLDVSEYTVSYENNVSAGTATVTIADKPGGDYIVSGTAAFEIRKATVTVTADDKTARIGGTMPELTCTSRAFTARMHW